jgi:flagellar biosynthesis/type III secretory pathway M-ring protein FliF/YscJ
VDYRYDGINRYASKTFAVHFLNLSSLLLIAVVLAVATRLAIKIQRRKGQKRPPAKEEPAAAKTAAKKSIKVVVKDDDK